MKNGLHWPIYEHVFGHIVPREFEVGVAEKVPNVRGIAGQQVIQTENVIAPLQ